MRVPRWVADIVADMVRSDAVEIVAVVVNDLAPAQRGDLLQRSVVDRVRSAWRHRNNVILNWYLRADEARYPAVGADPFERVDIENVLHGVRRLPVTPRQTARSDYFEEESLRELAAIAPDVGVRFGFRILRGAILELPRYGVWSFHHGDNAENRGGPAGLWEVLLGWRATGAILQRLSEQLDGGLVLARTRCVTNPVSVTQNRISIFRAAAPLLMRKLHDVHRRGEAAMVACAGEPSILPFSSRLYFEPTMSELIGGLRRIFVHVVRSKFRDVRTRDQWRIEYAFGAQSPPAGSVVPQLTMYRMKPLVPPPDRLWADPFPVEANGVHYVFFEELVFGHGRARIAVAEVSETSKALRSRPVLSPSYHLSYPFVFTHDGQWYMMPEMAAHGVQEIFRARAFPDEWEFDRVVDLGQPVVDATLLHHDGQWWLFAGTSPGPGCLYNELSIYFGDSPLGPWHPHVANPVISDARSARPAGRFFVVDGQLIRPGQDCTPEYGTAIALRRVTRLDREAYEEEPIGTIVPDWRPEILGTHTLNAAGALTVVDTRALTAR
jgi:methionyl-tRNA formyltransferase